jgi:rhodanese-related sulfurtransferase
MKIFIISILLFVITQIAAFAQNNCSDQPTGNLITDITPTQAQDTINTYLDKDWFVILDVRTPTEYNTMHINQGVNLNFNSGIFSTEVAKLDRNKVYVLHCASGARSGQAKIIMENLGFYRVYNMSGGLNSWNGSGYPTTTDVASIVDACELEYLFEDVLVGNSESYTFKITNAANDTLKISEISELAGTEFSTDFDIDTTLAGSFEYSFNVYYTPVDDIADNQTFTVTTNGGVIVFSLNGIALDFTGIASLPINPISITPISRCRKPCLQICDFG